MKINRMKTYLSILNLCLFMLPLTCPFVGFQSVYGVIRPLGHSFISRPDKLNPLYRINTSLLYGKTPWGISGQNISLLSSLQQWQGVSDLLTTGPNHQDSEHETRGVQGSKLGFISGTFPFKGEERIGKWEFTNYHLSVKSIPFWNTKVGPKPTFYCLYTEYSLLAFWQSWKLDTLDKIYCFS